MGKVGHYDAALICENGHLITSQMKSKPEDIANFCAKCGAKSISKCPSCEKPIDGYFHGADDGFFIEFSHDMDGIPNFCQHCGKPYPWMEKKLKAFEELTELMEELSKEERKDLYQSVMDVSSDNPRNQLGALKIKKVGMKVSKEIWNVAKDIIIQIGTEAALKQAGLK